MARTRTITRTLTTKVNLGHFESLDVSVTDEVVLDADDDRDAEAHALMRRLFGELHAQIAYLQSLSLYDKKTGRNIFVDPRDESDNEQARRLLPHSRAKLHAMRERLLLKDGASRGSGGRAKTNDGFPKDADRDAMPRTRRRRT